MRLWGIAFAFVIALTATTRAEPLLAIEGVAIVDVAAGKVLPPRTVVVRGDRIAAIVAPEAVRLPPGTERVDGRGHFLLPGLVDLHVHLFNNATRRPPNDWMFPLFLAAGVTGLREMAARPEDLRTIRRWRAETSRGERLAPRIVAAGVFIRGPSAAEARRQVRAARRAGADFVKVFSELPEPAWNATLAEARASHLPVCGHIPETVSILAAAAAGQRSNEHLTQLLEAAAPNEVNFLEARRRGVATAAGQEQAALEGFDAKRALKVARLLARAGQAQVPTLVLPFLEARGNANAFRRDPRWPLLRADEQARWTRHLRQRDVTPDRIAELRWQRARALVHTLHRAGARILAGTDASMPLVYPGSSLHLELELLVAAGLSPAEALRAATLEAARFLGADAESGSIAVGKRADLVLLDANPLQQIRHTRRIRAVILGGRLVVRQGGLPALACCP